MSQYHRSLLPVDNQSLTLNNTPISHYGTWLTNAALEIDATQPTTTITEIPGHTPIDQSLEDAIGSAIPNRRTITLHLRTIGDENDALQTKTKIGALAGTLGTIRWRNLPGEYRGRITVGAWQDVWSWGVWTYAECDLTIDADPYLYDRQRSKPLKAGDNLVRVDGNRPAWPTYTLTPANGAKSITVADKRGHHITINRGTAITGQIVIDTSQSTARIAGNLVPVTIDSDYFPILPKTTTITCTNCTGTIAYQPLTLI
ncbi:3-hydroxy-3-methylglutaryl CoA synthase [Bifidobacterium sp. 82T10]|uniref:3-hydroxy-3-methylglutaryl CoA synthase n=1 Tax=Bifidobacterium miconis TaxID=2834435 RepID=A0ABS6WF09_9BIFI|nr:3-hydroxy-3-methylglutaryl CoA synthase [Bifidobacterium miconis]MBW3092640.1 3-hydroxy-3-methylglutaryl CoA synthase [Bifidobacterium miconis]